MIPLDAYLDKVRALPPLMKTIINNDALGDALGELEDKYLLSGEQAKALLLIESSIIGQEYAPDQVYVHIKELLKLSDPIAQQLTVDFLGKIVMPMQWFVGNVEQIIRGFGGDPSSFAHDMQRRFPELSASPSGTDGSVQQTTAEKILDHFAEHLETFPGRAEILLRLTGLSATVEALVGRQHMSHEEGERALAELESISAAINTRDLNAFEVQSVQRRVKRIVDAVSEAGE